MDGELSYELYQRGKDAMERCEYESAINYFRDSIEHYPHFKTLELLGECFLFANKPVEAIPPLAAAISLGSNEFRAAYLLSRAFVEIDDFKKALAYAEQATKMKPDFRRAEELRQQILAKMERWLSPER